MTEISTPGGMDSSFGAVLRSRKADFVVATNDRVTNDAVTNDAVTNDAVTNDAVTNDAVTIAQFGAARIASVSWPGWPELTSAEPVFETYVVGAAEATPTSDNQPFVDAWLPLVTWLNDAVRSELDRHGVRVDGDAYVTASLSASAVLDGVAHIDDDSFVPTNNVGVVAIIGQHVGPRIATGTLVAGPLRPMSQLVFDDELLDEFAAGNIAHCQAACDEIAIFPQFGQLHAGPATAHLAEFSSRQLLVLRARVA